jgi:hypothetical protein
MFSVLACILHTFAVVCNQSGVSLFVLVMNSKFDSCERCIPPGKQGISPWSGRVLQRHWFGFSWIIHRPRDGIIQIRNVPRAAFDDFIISRQPKATLTQPAGILSVRLWSTFCHQAMGLPLVFERPSFVSLTWHFTGFDQLSLKEWSAVSEMTPWTKLHRHRIENYLWRTYESKLSILLTKYRSDDQFINQ